MAVPSTGQALRNNVRCRLPCDTATLRRDQSALQFVPNQSGLTAVVGRFGCKAWALSNRSDNAFSPPRRTLIRQ